MKAICNFPKFAKQLLVRSFRISSYTVVFEKYWKMVPSEREKCNTWRSKSVTRYHLDKITFEMRVFWLIFQHCEILANHQILRFWLTSLLFLCRFWRCGRQYPMLGSHHQLCRKPIRQLFRRRNEGYQISHRRSAGSRLSVFHRSHRPRIEAFRHWVYEADPW